MKQDKILKNVSLFSIMLMFMVCLFSFFHGISEEKVLYAEAKEQDVFSVPIVSKISIPVVIPKISYEVIAASERLPKKIDSEMKMKLGDNFIAIEKPEADKTDYQFKLDDLAVDRRIILSFTENMTQSITSENIHRVYQGKYYNKGTSSQPDFITGMEIHYEEITETTTITLDLVKTFGYQLLEDSNYFYVSMVNPHELYSTIIVLDAGHGGNDSGTYSNGYEYLEKDMNLDILQKLIAKLSNDKDIKVYTTRTSDRSLTLNQRVNLANDVEADLFLSVHCNANVSKSIHGTEVLYNDKQNDWETFHSKQFAIICQEELVKMVGLKNRGIVPRSKDVRIIGESKVPVALVEVAFMSNTSDMNFLKKESNRDLIAEGIYNGVHRALNEINSAQNDIGGE